uniref:Uncharacterized protein n=1 Tax=Pseudonaja textilis TaxID=8673 RepID=A0A670ZBF1_PSETE
MTNQFLFPTSHLSPLLYPQTAVQWDPRESEGFLGQARAPALPERALPSFLLTSAWQLACRFSFPPPPIAAGLPPAVSEGWEKMTCPTEPLVPPPVFLQRWLLGEHCVNYPLHSVSN